MSKLALFGGAKTRESAFPPHPVIGEEEKQAVLEVLDSGRLSTFIAAQGEYFNGGQKIRQFEREFAQYHGVEYAVAFNSATAALHAAVVAVGVEPGEEVIVPPYTFTSTATCALMHNAIPVFADIDPDSFCLDAAAVERAISPLTRAIIPVHLFGGPADVDALLAVARRHKVKLIEDCAQAPGALYRGKLVGTMADCGIFSFTENKNITTGEGGMLITNDPGLAEVARLVRNHGEMIDQAAKFRTYNSTMLGWNYRMTEMEAALGVVQFRKMDALNQARIELSQHLSRGLRGIDGLQVPEVDPRDRHVFYVYGVKYDADKMGVPRDLFGKALNAEGVPFSAGYVRPLYLTAVYQRRNAFAFRHYTGNATYEKGLCPVTERMHERELILTPVARPPATIADMEDVLRAVHKLVENRAELLEHAAAAAAK